MTVKIDDFRIDFHATHHAIHQWGATITWPNGKKSYGEYRTVGDAINKVRELAKKERKSR